MKTKGHFPNEEAARKLIYLAIVNAVPVWPALLTDPAVAVLARFEGDRLVAGAVARRSAAAIGLTKVSMSAATWSAWRGGAATARARWGPMPVVGDDFGESLAAAHQAGFTTAGELLAWAKPTAGHP